MSSRRIALAAAAAALLATATPAPAQQPAPQGTLRVVLVNMLASLDPVLSTAAFVRNHGFMVYDQLYAFDSRGEARPQMVDRHEVSADGMTYRFTLREGLAFHDGQPVRAADAVASIRRWAQRDIAGRDRRCCTW
jgi:peptide/nickel transport system substrate-binding protein